MIVAGTGSRSLIKDPLKYELVVEELILKLLNEKPTLVITGMAEGFDEALAEAAGAMKTPYHAYVPNAGYGDYYWRKNSQLGIDRYARYIDFLNNAEEVKFICPSIYVHGQHSNFIRNEAMVHAADKMWVWDPTSRGTSHCVKYAINQGVPWEEIKINEE